VVISVLKHFLTLSFCNFVLFAVTDSEETIWLFQVQLAYRVSTNLVLVIFIQFFEYNWFWFVGNKHFKKTFVLVDLKVVSL